MYETKKNTKLYNDKIELKPVYMHVMLMTTLVWFKLQKYLILLIAVTIA